MSYFSTKVPTWWCPEDTFHLSKDVFLKPGKRTAYKNYPGAGSTVFFPTLNFISEAENQEEHIDQLRQWAIFHSFILRFSHLCYFFEDGWLKRHKLMQRKPRSTAKKVINDDVGKHIYFLHPDPPTLSYKALFEQYQAFTKEQVNLLRTYLLPLSRHQTSTIYPLFDESRMYWQIAVYASVLEAIIGHAANCPGGVDSCPICGKRLQPHRQGSEKEWRKSYLSIIPDQATRDKYLNVINAAYGEIRHPTAHAGYLPIPEFMPPEIGTTEIYDLSRSIEEFSTDLTALRSLLMSVEDVTRYLLLQKLFALDTFPKLAPLKAIRIGGQPSNLTAENQ